MPCEQQLRASSSILGHMAVPHTNVRARSVRFRVGKAFEVGGASWNAFSMFLEVSGSARFSSEVEASLSRHLRARCCT